MTVGTLVCTDEQPAREWMAKIAISYFYEIAEMQNFILLMRVGIKSWSGHQAWINRILLHSPIDLNRTTSGVERQMGEQINSTGK